jgi:hypothetical protein
MKIEVTVEHYDLKTGWIRGRTVKRNKMKLEIATDRLREYSLFVATPMYGKSASF